MEPEQKRIVLIGGGVAAVVLLAAGLWFAFGRSAGEPPGGVAGAGGATAGGPAAAAPAAGDTGSGAGTGMAGTATGGGASTGFSSPTPSSPTGGAAAVTPPGGDLPPRHDMGSPGANAGGPPPPVTGAPPIQGSLPGGTMPVGTTEAGAEKIPGAYRAPDGRIINPNDPPDDVGRRGPR
jgi:hypothetical protein